MGTHPHWTHSSIEDFVYAISASYTGQLELKMQEVGVSQNELAKRLNKSPGRVSQVINDPGNLSLKLIVEYAKALGMKVGIIAYDDSDPDNLRGPIRPEVFVKCWEKANKPRSFYQAQAPSGAISINKIAANSGFSVFQIPRPHGVAQLKSGQWIVATQRQAPLPQALVQQRMEKTA